MLLCVVVVAALAAVSHARVEYQDPAPYLRFPAGSGKDANKCLDNQIYKFYDVGETWSTPYSGCKQSECVRDDAGVLHIARYSCPNFFRRIDFARVKSEHLHCRRRTGNSNKGYPDCCRTLYCEHYDENHKRVELPADNYPWLPKDQWPDA